MALQNYWKSVYLVMFLHHLDSIIGPTTAPGPHARYRAILAPMRGVIGSSQSVILAVLKRTADFVVGRYTSAKCALDFQKPMRTN